MLCIQGCIASQSFSFDRASSFILNPKRRSSWYILDFKPTGQTKHLNKHWLLYTFCNVPHIKIMFGVGHFLSGIFDNLSMAVCDKLSDFQSFTLDKTHAADKSFFFHVIPAFNFIALEWILIVELKWFSFPFEWDFNFKQGNWKHSPAQVLNVPQAWCLDPINHSFHTWKNVLGCLLYHITS